MGIEVKEFYDKFEKDKLSPYSRMKLVFRMNESASMIKGQMLLDVGCRRGELRRFLNGQSYVGVDITSKHYRKGFDFVVADVNRLPFKDQSFDTVSALELIEHVFNPHNFLEETSRVLKKEGTLVLSTPNIACLLNRFKIFFGIAPSFFGTDSGHLHCFTYKTLKKLLVENKFRIIERKTLYSSIPPRRVTIKILPFLFQKMLAQLLPNLSDILLVKAAKT